MNEYIANLDELTQHGHMEARIVDGALEAWTTRSVTPVSFNLIGDSFKKSYIALPGRYRLPFRLDMAARLDYPALFLFVGGGHVTFGSPWQDNRKIEDIHYPSGKPNQDHYSYDGSLPFGEYTDISVTYGLGEMQILIGGEERFYSRKQAYMKPKANNPPPSGDLQIKLAVSKLSTLSIKSIAITEYDGDAPVARGSFELADPKAKYSAPPKPTFEGAISSVPQPFRDEISEMDLFLKSLRPMKFRRTIERNGNRVSYVASDYGISYALNISGAESSQNLGWYFINAGNEKSFYQKSDRMEEALAGLSQSDPELAGRIFYALNDCIGCYGPGCLAKKPYAHGGQKRLSCHGRVHLRMCLSDFADVRKFFRYLNDEFYIGQEPAAVKK